MYVHRTGVVHVRIVHTHVLLYKYIFAFHAISWDNTVPVGGGGGGGGAVFTIEKETNAEYGHVMCHSRKKYHSPPQNFHSRRVSHYLKFPIFLGLVA